MKIQPHQLEANLRSGLVPIYLVSGDEPLLVQEACDAIRQSARNEGFEDRLTFHADHQLDWRQVAEELNALSLFAEKRRIEIHLPNGKLGDGRTVIEEFLAQPPEDIVLILISAKLDAAETRRKWYKDLQNLGVHLPIWPIDHDRFPGWLQKRAEALGLHMTRGAIQSLADRLEGNLLAASQELQRLALFSDGKTIDEDSIEESVQDSSRFNGFELVTELLEGNAAHCMKMINVLQQEGENPIGLLTVLVRDLHLTLELQQAVRTGKAPAAFLKQKAVFQPQRAKALEKAGRRLNRNQILRALSLCRSTDRAAKGADDIPSWHHLKDLAALLATPMAVKT